MSCFNFQGDDRIYNVLDDGRRTSLDRVYMCLLNPVIIECRLAKPKYSVS